jgi:hypothetical protein
LAHSRTRCSIGVAHAPVLADQTKVFGYGCQALDPKIYNECAFKNRPEWWSDLWDMLSGFNNQHTQRFLLAIPPMRYKEQDWPDQCALLRSKHRFRMEEVDRVEIERTPENDPSPVAATAAVISSEANITMEMIKRQ